MDTVGLIMAFESGELSEEETLQLFQHLLNTGRVWQLQGLGRYAKRLLDDGLITTGRSECIH